jgi:hypothetical protein
MADAGLCGGAAVGRSDVGKHDSSAKILSIGEVTAKKTVIKCMGRTYAAVAADGEVAITDTTDITHLVQLGTARSRDEHGAWQVVTARNEYVLTTSDLLRAVAALRESASRTFLVSH